VTHAEDPDPRRWKTLALLCVAGFMVNLDSQIVILALPSIQEDLGLGLEFHA
jgi:MFS family permease